MIAGIPEPQTAYPVEVSGWDQDKDLSLIPCPSQHRQMEKFLLYPQQGEEESNIMLLENFR